MISEQSHTHTPIRRPSKSPWCFMQMQWLPNQCIPAAQCTLLIVTQVWLATQSTKWTFQHVHPVTAGNPVCQWLSIVSGLSGVRVRPLPLPITSLTFILPILTQHLLLNVKQLCCWWCLLGVRAICQGSVQYPLNHNLKPLKAWGYKSQLSGLSDQRLIVFFIDEQ